MDIEAGNAYEADTQGTGWFVGFSPWTLQSALRHVPQEQPLTGLCVKWFDHPSGQASGAKPVSAGRTLSILVGDGGPFRIEFSQTADFGGDLRSIVLQRQGDYAAWGPGLFHRWQCEQRCTVLTVRWSPA